MCNCIAKAQSLFRQRSQWVAIDFPILEDGRTNQNGAFEIPIYTIAEDGSFTKNRAFDGEHPVALHIDYCPCCGEKYPVVKRFN